MIPYIFSIKFGINTVEFFVKTIPKYDPRKHGKIWFTEQLEDNITRKKLNWYLRNYSDMWTFLH